MPANNWSRFALFISSGQRLSNSSDTSQLNCLCGRTGIPLAPPLCILPSHNQSALLSGDVSSLGRGPIVGDDNDGQSCRPLRAQEENPAAAAVAAGSAAHMLMATSGAGSDAVCSRDRATSQNDRNVLSWL